MTEQFKVDNTIIKIGDVLSTKNGKIIRVLKIKQTNSANFQAVVLKEGDADEDLAGDTYSDWDKDYPWKLFKAYNSPLYKTLQRIENDN